VRQRFRGKLHGIYRERLGRVVLDGSRARGGSPGDSDHAESDYAESDHAGPDYEDAVFLHDPHVFRRDMDRLAGLGTHLSVAGMLP